MGDEHSTFPLFLFQFVKIIDSITTCTMVFRQLLSKIVVPNLEKDLSSAVAREVSKMGSCNFAPQVYGYLPKTPAMGGSFRSTVATRQQVMPKDVLLTRVDVPFKPNQGLFHGC